MRMLPTQVSLYDTSHNTLAKNTDSTKDLKPDKALEVWLFTVYVCVPFGAYFLLCIHLLSILTELAYCMI